MRFAVARPVGANVIDPPTGREVPGRRGHLLALALAVVVAASCTSTTSERPLAGEVVEVVAVWEDAEAAAFGDVLDAFEGSTGAQVVYTSTAGADVATVLNGRVAAGDPPDVAILPQPALLADYASRGVIEPVGDVVGAAVRDRYAPEWRRLASVGGDLYGVWFKAANKSLIWYSIGAFERAGIVPPSALEDLLPVAAGVSAAGTPAFAVPATAADAWTLTDLFENLYLRLAGPSRYDALAAHRIPWTDPSVEEALRALMALLAPGQVAVLGPDAGFPDAVAAVFDPAPRAAMVVEGDFVPGVVAGEIAAELGIDVDVFAFPELGRDRFVVGGGDVAVLMRRSPAAEALLQHLATAGAAEVWARQGGFVSPNEEVDLAVYPDEATRRSARALLDAGGGGFRFDLSDLQPAAFGATAGAGLRGVLHDLVHGRADVSDAARRLEAEATEAWGAPAGR